nr:Gfo/Idh/MocA family oxidoreductase [Chloroflexaceae bacterium]
VAIIGTGFGVTTQVPGFRTAAGAEVVALCSARRERAEAAARQHHIPHAFDDYRAMLAQVQPDLVSIVTPVATHAPMTLAALEAGCHVLCEKPTALNAAEARAMLEQAEAGGRIHMIDHELRFNPTRARIAALLAEGYLGRVYYVQIRNVSGMRADWQRPWDWWSDRTQGGGALGASGSHQVDMLRWWLGEIVAVSGQLETFVASRPDPHSGAMRPVTSDDQFSFVARCASGVYAHVFVSYVAQHGGFNRIEIHGERGSLVLDHEERLWGWQTGDSAPSELTVPDPLAGTPGLPNSVWGLSFAHLARELVAAIGEGRPLERGATFHDGLRCQLVLDAVRQSWNEGGWLHVGDS